MFEYIAFGLNYLFKCTIDLISILALFVKQFEFVASTTTVVVPIIGFYSQIIPNTKFTIKFFRECQVRSCNIQKSGEIFSSRRNWKIVLYIAILNGYIGTVLIETYSTTLNARY